MKIQCACGAKFSFDITPDQAQQPVHFICPTCGVDSSAMVTALVRQQFGIAAPQAAPTIEIAAPPPSQPKPAVAPITISPPAPVAPAAPVVPAIVAPPSPGPVRVAVPTPTPQPAPTIVAPPPTSPGPVRVAVPTPVAPPQPAPAAPIVVAPPPSPGPVRIAVPTTVAAAAPAPGPVRVVPPTPTATPVVVPPPAPASADAPIRISIPAAPAPALPIVAPPPSATATVVPPAAQPVAIVAPPTAQPVATVVSVTPTPPSPPAAPPVARLVRSGEKPASASAPDEPVVDKRFCSKHPGVRTTEECFVCGKPLCPKCMALFGYLCSPLCKQKAELQGMDVPEYELQVHVSERRQDRKLLKIVGISAGVIGVILAVWFWWAWFGQKPTVVYATRFEKQSYSGASFLTPDNQIIFLHGSTLARHDVGDKKQIWSANLIDKAEVEKEVKERIASLHKLQDRLNSDAPDADPVRIPAPDRLARDIELYMAESMQLRVVGQNIWVQTPGKLVRYDWATGKSVKELKVDGDFGGFILRGDELLMFDEKPHRHIVNRVNLVTAETRKEEIIDPERIDPATLAKGKTNAPAGKPGAAVASKGKGGAGLPTGVPGQSGNKPLDPKKVEAQAARQTTAGRLAYPAVLATQRGQERLLEEMGALRDDEDYEEWPTNQFTFIPHQDGYVEYRAELLDHRTVQRNAMRDAPKNDGKSALDGPVTAGNSLETSIDMLNEMQRERGGNMITEDVSLYKITLRRAPAPVGVGADGKTESKESSVAKAPETKAPADAKASGDAAGELKQYTTDDGTWIAQVIGRPSVFPLKSVNVVAARKLIIVLDKENHKLWQAELTYDVDGDAALEEDPRRGQGPCVERDNKLFVFDEGVLTCFDLKKGTLRWRLPSVGITGLFFDDEGKLYVNTTTASHDSIKYSRQIDLTRVVTGMLLKLDAQTGKTLWTRELNGDLAYVSGKYLITMQSYWPPDYTDEEESPYGAPAIMQTDPFVRLRRINPRNGKDLWVHYQDRCPMDVQFEKNRIHLVFKKEVQVLKFRTL